MGMFLALLRAVGLAIFGAFVLRVTLAFGLPLDDWARRFVNWSIGISLQDSDLAFWVFAAFVAVGLFTVEFWLEPIWKLLRKERSFHEVLPPSPVTELRDVWLLDAIYWVATGIWTPPKNFENFQGERFIEVLRSVRQKAFDGELPVWGKRNASDIWLPIPAEYWQDHEIEYFDALRGNSETIEIKRRNSAPWDRNTLNWCCPMTSSAKVKQLWSQVVERPIVETKVTNERMKLAELAQIELNIKSFDQPDPSGKVQRWIDRMRQRAIDGEVALWGRKDSEPELDELEIVPLIPISAKYWHNAKINDYEFVVHGGRAQTAPADRSVYVEFFSDLHVCRIASGSGILTRNS